MREYQTQYICERCNQPYQITRNTPTNNKYCWPGNRTHAARLLQISHRALLYKLKEYSIRS